MATTQIKDGYQGGSDNQLKVNPDGSINVNNGGTMGTNVNIASVGGNTITTTVPISGTVNTVPSGTQTVAGTVTVTQATGTNLHTVIDSGTVSVSNFPATQPISGSVTVTQATGTNLHTVVDSSALPSGASTSALQTTGNASLSSIDTKTPALGQALAAASTPVVLPASQITALTPPTTVTVTQATGTNLHAVIDNGSIAVSNFPSTQPVSGTVAVSSLPSIPTGTNAIGSVSVSNFPATQPVSGSVSVSNFPATQPVSGTVTVSSITNPLPTGTNALGSVSVSNFPATQAVSGTVTANAGTGTFQTNVTNASIPVTQSGSWTTTVTQATAANLQVASNIVPLGTIKSSQQSVSNTAVQIASTALANRKSITVKNFLSSSVSFFIGDATVTSGNGFIVSPGESVDLDLSATGVLYAIAPSTVTVYILEIS